MKTKTPKYSMLIGLMMTLLFSACNPFNKVMEPMENIRTPAPDYSYVVEPDYNSSKNEVEFKIKDLYKAEDVKLTVATYHRYDDKTNEQINEDYWIHCV